MLLNNIHHVVSKPKSYLMFMRWHGFLVYTFFLIDRETKFYAKIGSTPFHRVLHDCSMEITKGLKEAQREPKKSLKFCKRPALRKLIT